MPTICTAGHVNHGKSELVYALTGTRTTRHPEERLRGMTIDLGFAFLEHPDGFPIGIVDVPGHEAFVKTMVSGATGVDAALWVVDAREGPRQQSREHLQILSLLGLNKVIPVITKADLATPLQIQATRKAIAHLLAQYPMSFDTPVAVDSVSLRGVLELRASILNSLSRDQPDEQAPTYLPIDRAFTLKGLGTVVTGTLQRGQLTTGDTVRISTSAENFRVRTLQCNHVRVHRVRSGQRVGVNVPGLAIEQLSRGAILHASSYPFTSRSVNARIRWVADEPARLSNGCRLLLHIGTTSVLSRVWGLSDNEPVPMVQLELPSIMPFMRNQRFILRSPSDLRVRGGGTIVDIAPTGVRKISSADRAVEEAMKKCLHWLPGFLHGQSAAFNVDVLASRWMLSPSELISQIQDDPTIEHRPALPSDGGEQWIWSQKWGQALLQRVQSRLFEMDRQQRRVYSFAELASRHSVDASFLKTFLSEMHRRGDLASLTHPRTVLGATTIAVEGVDTWSDSSERRLAQRLLSRLAKAGFEPPLVSDLLALGGERSLRVLQSLEERGLVVAIGPRLVLHADVARALRGIPQQMGLTRFRVAEFGLALRVSRKFSVPYLEYLADQGVTYRDGDFHVVVNSKPTSGFDAPVNHPSNSINLEPDD